MKGAGKKALSGLDNGELTGYSFDFSYEQKAYLVNVTGLSISASLVRGLISKGESIRYLLPDSVKSYIISHNLYKK